MSNQKRVWGLGLFALVATSLTIAPQVQKHWGIEALAPGETEGVFKGAPSQKPAQGGGPKETGLSAGKTNTAFESRTANAALPSPAVTPRPAAESPIEAAARKYDTSPLGTTAKEIPAGTFKTGLQKLSPEMQETVVARLIEEKIPVLDLNSLHVDATGELVYACQGMRCEHTEHSKDPELAAGAAAEGAITFEGEWPEVFAAAVPIDSPPVTCRNTPSGSHPAAEIRGRSCQPRHSSGRVARRKWP